MGNSALCVTKQIWRRKNGCTLGKSSLNIFQGKKLRMNKSKEEFTGKKILKNIIPHTYKVLAWIHFSGPEVVSFGCQFVGFRMTIEANLWEFMSGIIYIRLIQVGKHILNVACFTLLHGLAWLNTRELALSDSRLKYVMGQTALRFYCPGFQAMVDCHTML